MEIARLHKVGSHRHRMQPSHVTLLASPAAARYHPRRDSTGIEGIARGLCLVDRVRSGRARVVEFSHNETDVQL